LPVTAETIGWLLLAVTIAGAGWLSYSWWFPFRRCPRCRNRVAGSGWGSTSRAYNRRCRACGNTGEQVRMTARLTSKATGHPVRGARKDK
jgi:hypothetical protein